MLLYQVSGLHRWFVCSLFGGLGMHCVLFVDGFLVVSSLFDEALSPGFPQVDSQGWCDTGIEKP